MSMKKLQMNLLRNKRILFATLIKTLPRILLSIDVGTIGK